MLSSQAAQLLLKTAKLLLWICLFLSVIRPHPACSASRLGEFLTHLQPSEIMPGADHFGAPEGDPPLIPVMKGDDMLGYAYLNTDFSQADGYSGKPIEIVIGVARSGRIVGLKLVEHKEPIVLTGIPVSRIIAAMQQLIGVEIGDVARGVRSVPHVDIVSGATVTVLVIGDSIIRSAVKLVESGRLAPGAIVTHPPAETTARQIDLSKSENRNWDSLLNDGSIANLRLTVADVNKAFQENPAAVQHPESGPPDDLFIDLYTALASVPTIGRSLLGDAGFERLVARLAPGQQALLVAGRGRFSFKGSAYVRGGIFDRIELVQDANTIRFRDRDHTRIAEFHASGAPEFPEIGLFVIPKDVQFDPVSPWRLQLLVQRAIGAREKAFLIFDLPYRLPEKYTKSEQIAQLAPAARPEAAAPKGLSAQNPPLSGALTEPLWKRIWSAKVHDIAITAVTLIVLTAIFFFQDFLVQRPLLYTRVRRVFLAFILVWMGWLANAQLSVVNVITFINALVTGFHWEFFLTAPLIFILWAGVAAALLFWGRGPFCGWLCPFGALQELLNHAAQATRIPQIKLPWALHERLWPIKYVIFLLLFGVSLHSVALAEQLAEVEPFKTAIVLKFVRNWPFVLYAASLLIAGLFIERFFCRYLCPLGAALAIPGRIRMFEWLKRWPECGSPCQRCARECPVQSIHPDGHINPNECIYCMHCQELYWDDHRCPHMIQVRLKREKSRALTSPSMRSDAAGREPLGFGRKSESVQKPPSGA